MSLIPLGQSETDPVPDRGTPPARRRRYLVLAGTVAALLLAGGSAAYLLVAGTQPPNRPLTGPFGAGASTEPATIGATGPSDAGPSDTAPAADASPTATASPTPTIPTASVVAVTHPGRYRVSGSLCAAMDLTPLQKAAGGPGITRSNHTERVTFSDFMCSANLGPGGRVWVTAEVRIFPTTSAAAASFATDRTGTTRVPGLGTAAAQLDPPGAGYVLLVTDANLELRLQVGAVGPKPSPDDLRQPAIDTATRTLTRLHS